MDVLDHRLQIYFTLFREAERDGLTQTMSEIKIVLDHLVTTMNTATRSTVPMPRSCRCYRLCAGCKTAKTAHMNSLVDGEEAAETLSEYTDTCGYAIPTSDSSCSGESILDVAGQ